jgi:arabinofuranosyltransferase
MGRVFRPRVFVALAVLGMLGVGALAWPFTVDDAFVTARYAARLAAGRGLTFVDGPPSDGATGPLWLLPGVLAASVGASAVDAQKVLGLCMMVMAVALVVRRAARRAGGARAAPLVAAFCVAGPTLGVWGGAGLETGAATLALTGALLAATSRPRPRALTAGLCVGALAWLRPEACAAGCVALLAVFVRGDRRATATALGLAGALGLGVLAYRLALFGHALPLALAAKPGELAWGLRYAALGALVTTGGAGLGLAAFAGGRARAGERWLLAAVVVHLCAVALAGGDWMPGFRLLAPILPIAALLAGMRAARGFTFARTLAGKGALALAVVVALAVPALDLAAQLPAVRAAGEARERVGRPLARYLAAHARRVALVDVGFLAWVGGFDVVDLGGITDEGIARLPGPHLGKRIDEAWLLARAPDALVLHATVPPEIDADGALRTLAGYPVERRVAAMPGIRARFRVARVVDYAPGYVYVVLLPRPAP